VCCVEDVGEEEADELERHGNDDYEASVSCLSETITMVRTVPEKAEKVACRHTVYENFISAHRAGERAEG
jgi:hypothetical protein